jgi:hypothetical protein
MTAPFIFVGTHRIKEGQLDAYIEYFREFVEFVKENEPRLIVFDGFVHDEGTRIDHRASASRCGVDGVPYADDRQAYRRGVRPIPRQI